MIYSGNIDTYVDKRIMKKLQAIPNLKALLLDRAGRVMQYSIEDKSDYDDYIIAHHIMKQEMINNHNWVSAAIDDMAIHIIQQMYPQYKESIKSIEERKLKEYDRNPFTIR